MKRKLIALAAAGFLIFAFTGVCLAEPELSVTGWFRARSYWVPNIALDKTSTRERTYSEQRLILDPVLKITDAIQIKMRLRVLDHIWGYQGMPHFTFAQQITETGERSPADPNSNFTWDRAWVAISLGKYGLLQIGRMDCSLPLEVAVSKDDTYPRYNWMAPAIKMPESIGGILLTGLLYDKREEQDIDRTFGVPPAFWTPHGNPCNEVTAFCPWFYLLARNFKVFYAWFPFIFHYPESIGGNTIVHFHDLEIEAKLGPVNLESEFTILPGELYPDVKTVNVYWLYVDLSVPVEEEAVPVSKVAVQVGYAGGCVDPATHPENVYAGTSPFTLTKSGLWGMNKDFDVDLILWDQIYASVRNAMYIRARVDFKTPVEKLGGYLAGIYSVADQYARFQPPASVPTTMGDEKNMGFEINLGISYAPAEKSSIVLGLGYFMPGKYFAEPRDGTLAATVKTNIRF